MLYDRRTRSQINTKIKTIGQKANEVLKRPSAKAVEQLLYGILASQSVHVTKIGAALQDKSSLGSTENRLTTRLATDNYEVLQELYLHEVKSKITEETLLSLDPGDLAKQHGKKLENLAKIRDGDTGNIVPGYSLVGVVATGLKEEDRWLPLGLSLHSSQAEDYQSENREITSMIEQIESVVGKKGTWVIDRGGDRKELFSSFLDNDRNFLIRMVGNRHIINKKGKKLLAMDIAAQCKCRLGTIKYKKDGRQKIVHIGVVEVTLPGHTQPLSMIVLKGNDRKIHMLLLTTHLFQRGKNKGNEVLSYIRSYLRRWDVEMYFRFIKQSYGYETTLLRSYQGLQNLTTLLLLVSGLLASLTKDPRLRVLCKVVLQYAKRIGKKSVFSYYRLAEGIKNLLSSGLGFFSRGSMHTEPLPFASLSPAWRDI